MGWLRYRTGWMVRGLFLFYGMVPLCLNILIQPAAAQTLTEDSSLSTRVTSSGLDFTIDDGTRSGPNLFHSFSEFSVPSGGSATFTNANDVANIISRVTGSSASNVNGSITANGLANLFLLNPNGIIIGPGAQLKIGGSFMGSTAESIAFSDGTVFSTSLSAQAPILTISTPTGLQLGASSGPVNISGGAHKLNRSGNGALAVLSASNLSVAPGRTLALIGNEVSLEGGRLSTMGGRLELGSVGLGEVKFSPVGAGYSFDYTQVNEFADIEISQALLDGISPGGGLIQLQGQNISVLDGAEVYIQNQAPVNSSGGIIINASQQFSVAGRSPVTGIGSAVTSESLLGSGGDINISAQSIAFLGGIGVESIAIFAPGGNVTVNATDSILLKPSAVTPNNTTGIDTLSFGPVYAPAGELKVTTNQLTILGGSTIASLAQDAGDSGDVTVTAQSILVDGVNPIRLRPSIITSGTLSDGNAGNVLITTERLDVSAGGRIDSSTAAAGNAGSVTVNATEAITVSGRVAGSINPSLIVSSANLLDEELRIAFNLPPSPTGASGDLTLNTPTLSVTEGGQVTVRNDGSGKGGTLRINAGAIQLQDAGITASTQSGGGGNIDLTSTGPLLLRGGSILSAEAGGTGDGGNITLNTPFLIALENSDIVASAFEGDGGEIEIFAQSIIGTAFRQQLTDESDITASSEFGVNGSVTIASPNVDAESGLVQLPETPADASNQVVASCSAQNGNQFVSSGRGGLPDNPFNQLSSNRPWQDLRTINHSRLAVDDVSSASTTSHKIVGDEDTQKSIALALQEAGEWTVNEAGQIELLVVNALAHSTGSCLEQSTASVQ